MLGGTESWSGARVTVRCNEAALCAFKFHDPLFTAGAGWLAGSASLAHAALNNWDCKVNVRRMVKDGSFPPASQQASQQASQRGRFSQLAANQQISHQRRPRVTVGHGVCEY